MAQMTAQRRHRPTLREQIAQEQLRASRDARYRTNLAFAIAQLRALVLLGSLIGSIAFGWPMPHAELTHLVQLGHVWQVSSCAG